MIYKSFEIKNFKGIDKVNIDLSNTRIVTLVGLNESGKTTIMEAIKLFHDMIKGNQISEERLREFRPKGIAFTGSVEIEGSLCFEEDDKEKLEHHWQEVLKKTTKLILPEKFGYRYQFIYNLHSYKETKMVCDFEVRTKTSRKKLYDTDKDGWLALIKYITAEILPEILYYDDFAFQIPERISFAKSGAKESTVDDAQKRNNQIWQLVINDVLKSVDKRLSFQRHIVDIWENDKDAAFQRLAQMERALNQKITQRWGDLFGKNKVHFKEIKLEAEYNSSALYLTFKISTENRAQFSVKERSKGFKWFFSFLLFTEFRKRRTRNILFLLDEPASYLHSSAQNKILDAISDLSKDSLVIYSTHSHHLINPAWLMGAYICVNENLSKDILAGDFSTHEGAKISAIKYFNYVGKGLSSDKISYFQPILDSLDYAPSTIEPIPEIILLEGKNDWYTFNYFDRVLLKRNKNLHYYPGGGKDKLFEIIRLYLAWGKNFIVLLDGDNGGITSKDTYLKEFGPYLSNRIFTLEDILKKKGALEQFINQEDQEIIHDAYFGAGMFKRCLPNKLKENLNLAINQLNHNKTDLNLSIETKENFAKMISYLEKRLKSSAIHI